MSTSVNRNAKRASRVRRSEKEARSVLIRSFAHALTVAPSHAAAAKWMNRKPVTVRRWLSGDYRLDVEAIMCSPKLWRAFLGCLIEQDRKSGWL